MKKFLSSLLASLMAAALGVQPALAESLSVATSYPSPTGIYKNLTTTQQTTLARDGGNVGIGTSVPGTALDVWNSTNAYIRAQSANANAALELLNPGNELYDIMADRGTNSLLLGSYGPGAAGLMMSMNGGNGFVGVNTAAQDSQLTVQSGTSQISLKNGAGATKGYIGTNAIFGTVAGADDLRIRSDSNQIVFGFSGQPNLVLHSYGSLNLSDASAPYFHLTVPTPNTTPPYVAWFGYDWTINANDVGTLVFREQMADWIPLVFYGDPATGGTNGFLDMGHNIDGTRTYGLRWWVGDGNIGHTMKQYSYMDLLNTGSTSPALRVVVGNAATSPIQEWVAGFFNQFGFSGDTYGTNHPPSSRDFKRNISPLSDKDYKEINEIFDKIPLYSFERKDDPSPKIKEIGFIAEDSPEIIRGYEKKYMNSWRTVGVMAAVIKNQDKRIAELEKTLAEIQAALKAPRKTKVPK